MRLKVLALSAALAASLGLAACGDDADDAATTAPPPAADPAAPPPAAPAPQ